MQETHFDKIRRGEVMGNIGIFANTTHIIVTLTAFFLLFLSCFYTEKGTPVRRGIWFLFFGLLLDLVVVAIEYQSFNAYKAGSEVEIYVFFELLLLLGSMVLLAVAASQILLKNIPDLPVILGVAGLGLISVVSYVFIFPDGNMVSSLRYVFPIAGFAYLSVGFLSQVTQRYKSGYVLASVVTAAISLLMILKLSHIGWAVDGAELWYSSALFYVLLAIAILIIKINALSTKYENQEEEVRKSNQRLADIIKSSPFPIILSKLNDDKIIMANTNAVKLFGILPQEVDRYRLKDFFVDVDNRRLLNERLEKEKEVQDFEILVKTPSGDTPFWLLASVNIIDYNYDVVLYSAFQDITSRKNREMLLKNQAIRDPLTSLYNRRYFEEEVFNRIVDAKANNEKYCVLMLDADHFKRVNDTYGHKIGDKVLIELAYTCEKNLREDDIVARYGGEEFVVFLPHTTPKQAEVVAERLRESIASAVVYSDEGEEVRFTVSIGISSSEISDNVGMLIKTSDEALYRAKQTGRNRYCVFRPEDFENMGAEDEAVRKENQNHHPIFDKEDAREISLLDGIDSSRIQEENVEIEEKKKKPGKMNILGVDDEDL